MKRILVTGASGFVGQSLIPELSSQVLVRALTTSTIADPSQRGLVEMRSITSLHEAGTRPDLFEGCDAVIHLAARVHVMKDSASDPLAEFRKINVEGTRSLALAAAQAGVRQFVYLSSAKVNGEATSINSPFRESDEPHPEDPYGLSKLEAERAIFDIADRTALKVTVLRPPLIYGPGVKANFLNLMRAVSRGIPLPLGAITSNRRSLLYVGNLVHGIQHVLDRKEAFNQVFLIGDETPVSTKDLTRAIGDALGNSARLIPIPAGLLKAAGSLIHKRPAMERLIGSLELDTSKLNNQGWMAPFSMKEGLLRTAEWFRSSGM